MNKKPVTKKSSSQFNKDTKNEKRKREESGEISSSSESSDSDSDSSQSSTSSSSSSDSLKRKTKRKRSNSEDGEVDSDTIDSKHHSDDLYSKIKNITKLIDKTKHDHDTNQHKLEKIQRAYLKAEKENNKINMKKCFKYKQKYEIKVDKIKANIKILQAKRAKLQQQLESTDKLLKPTKIDSKPTSIPAPTKAPIRLPFPVLNDTRDMKTILGTLETKQAELINKIEMNRTALNEKTNNYSRVEKLKQLEQLFESQLEKINIQLDYVRLSLNLEALQESNMNQPIMIMQQQQILIDQMSARLSEMYNKMKMENKLYLKAHQQQQMSDSKVESADHQSKSQISPPKTIVKPIDKLNQLHDGVNNALAAVIAHTAACAHAAAAVAVTNYYMSAYYSQQQQSESDTKQTDQLQIEPVKQALPLKEEIKNASSVFNKLKSKISCFFEVSKQVEEKISKKKETNSALKQLVTNYGDDEDVDDDNEKQEEVVELKPKEVVNKETNEESDEDSSEEDESDYEIVTTSELKQSTNVNRNYLLPSLKASYFPLKASLTNWNEISNRSLIAVEKSKNAITFLGNGNCVQKQLKLNDILFS